MQVCLEFLIVLDWGKTYYGNYLDCYCRASNVNVVSNNVVEFFLFFFVFLLVLFVHEHDNS